MFHPRLFENRNVVVTGAGRGIGLEVARQFLDCGAKVLVHVGRAKDRPLPDFLLTAEEDRRAFLIPADFSSGSETLEFAAKVLTAFDRLHVLVNNAGTMFGRFPADTLTDEQYGAIVQLNQTSVVELTRALLPALRAAAGGRHRQHRIDLRADRREPRLGDLFGIQGVRGNLLKGAGKGTRAGRNTRQLRFSRNHRDRFSSTLFLAGEAGTDPQEHTAPAAGHG